MDRLRRAIFIMNRPILIILEGVDGAGKSSVCHGIQDKATIIHRPYQALYGDIVLDYLELINSVKTLTVWDRSFISEMVYGPVLRGCSRLSHKQFGSLLRALKNKGSVVIYLYATADIIRRRLEKGPNHLTILENLESLCNSYRSVLLQVGQYLPVLAFDTTSTDKNTLVELIKKEVSL